MTTEPIPTQQEHRKPKVIRQGGVSEAVYGMSLIGAWVYYLSHVATFWLGVLEIFKGIFWPAMLVYELLKYLHMLGPASLHPTPSAFESRTLRLHQIRKRMID
jgi:hypothetical protein